MKHKIKWLVGLLAVGVIVIVSAARAQYMTGETVPQSQTVLDSYFTTNATPGQQQYWELIDTMFWYIESTYTDAVAAAQSAQVSEAINNRVIGSIYVAVGLSSGGQQTWTYYATNGFSSNSVAIGTLNPHGVLCYYVWLTNYFATPLPSVAWTSFHGPAFFTLTMPPMSGGDLTNNSTYEAFSGFSGSGANVQVFPYTTSDSTNTYVLTPNYFAFYVNLGGASTPNEITNGYLFTFYQ